MEVLDPLPASGSSGTTLGQGDGGPAGELLTIPPADPAAAESWALAWARARLAARARRDYKEADRIRDLLKGAGWEIRDNRDGTAEVRRP